MIHQSYVQQYIKPTAEKVVDSTDMNVPSEYSLKKTEWLDCIAFSICNIAAMMMKKALQRVRDMKERRAFERLHHE
jgi:hypothetical protein